MNQQIIKEFLKPKLDNDNDDSAAIKKPPVLGDLKQEESSYPIPNIKSEINTNNGNDSHRGENARSTFEEKQSKSLFHNPLISEEIFLTD